MTLPESVTTVEDGAFDGSEIQTLCLGKALEKGEVDGALADEFKSLGSQNKDSLKGMKNGLFHN